MKPLFSLPDTCPNFNDVIKMINACKPFSLNSKSYTPKRTYELRNFKGEYVTFPLTLMPVSNAKSV